MRTKTCDELLKDDENATCEMHTLNRDVYPPNRELSENEDMQCYIPDTWLDSYVYILYIYVYIFYIIYY